MVKTLFNSRKINSLNVCVPLENHVTDMLRIYYLSDFLFNFWAITNYSKDKTDMRNGLNELGKDVEWRKAKFPIRSLSVLLAVNMWLYTVQYHEYFSITLEKDFSKMLCSIFLQFMWSNFWTFIFDILMLHIWHCFPISVDPFNECIILVFLSFLSIFSF